MDQPMPSEDLEEIFSYDNPEWYRDLMLHLRYSFRLTEYELVAKKVASFLNKKIALPPPVSDTVAVSRDIEDLRTKGWCGVGQLLSPSEVKEVHKHFSNRDMRLANDETLPTAKRATAPADMNIAEYSEPDVVAAPHLGRIANHPDVLARVAGFLEVPPTIQYLASWWSFSGRDTAKDAQLFHFDRACYRFLKLFVFLTDVTMDTGPHCFVEGSGRHADWQKRYDEIRRTDPDRAAHFWSMLQAQRREDEDIAAFFGPENIRYIQGKAGAAFLVNTAAFHKGVPPKSEDRLIFQALYTMLPTIKHGAPRTKHQGYHRAIANPGVEDAYLRYVNRLIIDDPRS
ncbi:MAG: phytanoyl-CoA dioxygenase family protein [Alphaproteobacteria bacterium]|jgi:hypothetical protein|nr:phytanoyl-CoA dioxygenase family protein [Alphaproteobacteria bacterium]